MSEHIFSVKGGESIRLKTAGKYCDRDIVVNAPDNLDALIGNTITEVNSEAAEIGAYKFFSCNSLVRVSIPNASAIGANTFNGCTALAEVNIPKATGIGTYAFNNCQSLEVADFPLVATFSGNYNFQNCHSLHTVNIPKLGAVNGYCFQNCTSLTKVKFPVAGSVAAYAFDGCTNLQIVDLPRVLTITGYAFRNCSNLVALAIRHETSICKLSNINAFAGTPIADGTGYIYAPEKMINSLKVASNWSTYATQFRVLEQYTVDGTVTGDLDESKI